MQCTLCSRAILSDGTIDDTSNSNNGDIVKVLATVISILKDFTLKNPKAYVFFTGSTDERVKLYVVLVTKTFHPAEETHFPEKVKKAKEILTKAGFRPF
jgi:hypothetical protein